MVARKLKLLRFEYEIDGTPQSFVTLTVDDIESKEETKQYIYNKIVEERKSQKDIFLVGVSDIGNLHIIAPSVEKHLKEFYAKETRKRVKKQGI
jgi:hypothetical protein